MKKLLVLCLFLPFMAKAQFKIVNTATISLVELRPETWPIKLVRITKESDTSYMLSFRSQEYVKEVIMKNMKFTNLKQLKYFQQGLSSLKNGSNGDVAEFKDYSIKRVDVKKEGIWYILTYEGAITNFQQPEADKLIAAIVNL